MRIPILSAMALVGVSAAAGEVRLAYRVLEPELGRIEREANGIRHELEQLPPLSLGNSGIRRGYHGSQTPIAGKSFSVVIDLGVAHPIDAIALVPTEGKRGPSTVLGYGFPLRFKIDISDDPDFRHFTTVADETKEIFPNPGPYPYYAEAAGRKARYVRLLAVQRWPLGDRIWAIALAEIFVLSAGRDVAEGATVVAGRAAIHHFPIWLPENLVDHQTDLGLPVSSEPSRTHGYHSRPEQSENAVKWVQVDLGSAKIVDEVRLLPAHPGEVPTPGYGFPRRFRVEAADEPQFHHSRILADYTREDFLNPGNNIVSIPGRGASARYVRVTATRLYEQGNRGTYNLFALAELQVFSGSRNVALGAAVRAKDVLEGPRPPHIAAMYPDGPTWALEFLVDGYSSRNRLIGLQEWLSGLAKRGRLERRLEELEKRRSTLRDEAAALTFSIGIGATVLLGGGLIGATLYLRHRRSVQLRELRRGLARDLHDEIGSSLGGIRLTSQLAQSVPGTPDAVLHDLREIEHIAGETADSMRDIVWLMDGESAGAGELIQQMQIIAGRMLADREFTVDVHASRYQRELHLELRRSVLFAFKEALYNAARHSGAARIEVSIEDGSQNFGFRVRDNGRGFNPAENKRGHGLANLRKRAALLGGWVAIESAAGAGASVEFRVPVG